MGDNKPSQKVTAGAAAGAISIVAVWLIGLFNVDVPPEVAVAFSTVFSFGLSWLTVTAED